MRPFPLARAPPRLEPDDDFLAPEPLAEDDLLADPDDFDLDAAPLEELLFAVPPFEAPPLALDVFDAPDLDPPVDLDPVEREELDDFEDPVPDDPADLDAVVFFAPDLADDEPVDFEDDDPDLVPADDRVPPDLEFDDFDPPDLAPLDLDPVDFDVEDFLVVGIFVSSVCLNLEM